MQDAIALSFVDTMNSEDVCQDQSMQVYIFIWEVNNNKIYGNCICPPFFVQQIDKPIILLS